MVGWWDILGIRTWLQDGYGTGVEFGLPQNPCTVGCKGVQCWPGCLGKSTPPDRTGSGGLMVLWATLTGQEETWGRRVLCRKRQAKKQKSQLALVWHECPGTVSVSHSHMAWLAQGCCSRLCFCHHGESPHRAQLSCWFSVCLVMAAGNFP